MKKIVMFIPILIIFLSSFSPDYVPKPADVEKLYQTKTLVVLSDNPMAQYNFVIKDFMKKEWKLTPYDFITSNEFDDKRMDPQYSFILLNQVRFDKDKSLAKYEFLSLVLGGKEKIVSNMPDFCPLPVAYYGVDEDHYDYKLQVLLRFMQKHVEMLHKNPKMLKVNMFKYYNENMGDVKDKTLYIVKDELAPDVNTAEKIKKVYPYKFKIVTRDEVSKAIDSSDSTVVFLHKVGPEGTKLVARCYNIIMGASDAEIYYFEFHKVTHDEPDGFLLKDFKKLARK
jgi:hypothetical protein